MRATREKIIDVIIACLSIVSIVFYIHESIIVLAALEQIPRNMIIGYGSCALLYVMSLLLCILMWAEIFYIKLDRSIKSIVLCVFSLLLLKVQFLIAWELTERLYSGLG